jgi:hypothetical protein
MPPLQRRGVTNHGGEAFYDGGRRERKKENELDDARPSKEGKKPLLTSAWNSLLPGKMGIYVGMRKMPEQHSRCPPSVLHASGQGLE